MLEALPPNPRIVASGNAAIPFEMLRIIDHTLPEFTLNMLAAHAGLPMREGITHETSFVGAGMRKSPRLAYVPARLSMVPLLFSRTLLPDAVVAHTSLPHNGKLSLGIEANVIVGAIEACKARGGKIIAQANAKMPYTFGDAEYDIEDFDAIYEVDLPIATSARRPKVQAATGDAAVIGELVSSRVHDGATLQLGIGMVPDATLPFLAKLKGLGIWSEMFSDGVLSLIDAGAMDPERKITASFAAGSAELYEWMHLNPQVLMLRTETTNDPAAIAMQPQMTSINTALQVDLFGVHEEAFVEPTVRQSWPCAPGIPRLRSPRSCPSSRSRSPRSSTVRSSPSRASPRSSATTRLTNAGRSSTRPRIRAFVRSCGRKPTLWVWHDRADPGRAARGPGPSARAN